MTRFVRPLNVLVQTPYRPHLILVPSPNKSPNRQWINHLRDCPVFHRLAMPPAPVAPLLVPQGQYLRQQIGSDAARYNVGPRHLPACGSANTARHQHQMRAMFYAMQTSNYNAGRQFYQKRAPARRRCAPVPRYPTTGLLADQPARPPY